MYESGAPAASVAPDARPLGATLLSPNARWALRVAVALTGVYLLLDIVAQLLPPHYSAVTQAESDLAVGPFGYVMTVNFVVRGVLTLSFLGGLLGATTMGRRSPVGVGLVAVWGVGAFILAASPTDLGSETTVHGMVHLATAAIAFLAAAVGELLLSVRCAEDPRLAPFRPAALAFSLSALVSLLALFYIQLRPHLFDAVFGLVERVFIGFVLLWILAVAVYLLRSDGSVPAAQNPN
jgi:hypothetical protein